MIDRFNRINVSIDLPAEAVRRFARVAEARQRALAAGILVEFGADGSVSARLTAVAGASDVSGLLGVIERTEAELQAALAPMGIPNPPEGEYLTREQLSHLKTEAAPKDAAPDVSGPSLDGAPNVVSVEKSARVETPA